MTRRSRTTTAVALAAATTVLRGTVTAPTAGCTTFEVFRKVD